MADDVVKTITIKGQTQGVDEATASLNKLADAQANVSVVSDKSSKSTLSVESALERQQRSLDATYRAQQTYNTSQKVINQGVAEGLISQDRANQLLDLAAQRFDRAAGSASPFAKALSGVHGQLVALSAGAGPVGVFLSSFGPLGLAAAVGFAAVTSAIEYMVSEANRMGDVTRQIRDLSDTLQLSTTNLQVLNNAGANVGLTSEDVARAFETFARGLGTLRDGSGALYDQLQRVNPALVTQLATTRDAATAWNLLAQAYKQADAQQQALITNAAFGRGGAGAGRLLTSTANAGGIQGLPTPPELLSHDQVEQWSTLRIQIEDANKSAHDLMASLWTQDVLAREKQGADSLLSAAATLKQMQDGGLLDYFTKLQLEFAGSIDKIFGSHFTDEMAVEIAAQAGGGARRAPGPAAAPPGASFNDRFGFPGATAGNATLSSEFQSNQLKAQISALGTAATYQEQYKSKVLELNAALKLHTITQETYNRAVAGLNLQTVIQLETQRIALLGQGTTVQEVVKQKEDEIAAARQKGVSITTQEAQGILAYTAAQKLSADTALLTTNNVVTAEQLRATKLAELNAAVLQGKLTQDQATASLAAYQKVIEQTIETQTVARATFTNLAQLQNQAGSLRGQLDTFATDTSNNIGSAFVDIATGAKTAKDAFANLEQQVIKSLANILIQFAIVKPIAQSFESILGGGFNFLGSAFGGSPTSLNPGNYGGTAGILSPLHHTGGIIGSEPTGMRYVHPAYFENAPRFHTGGIAGDEVPIVARKGEGVFTPGQMAALGGTGGGVQVNVNVVNNNDFSDVQVTRQKNSQGGVDIGLIIDQRVNDRMAKGFYDKPMSARFGVRPVGQRR